MNSYWDQISVYLKKYGFDANNKDFNFLKLVEELKAAIQIIKKQPFNVTIKSENNNVGNSNIINTSIQVQKIGNNILELTNYGDTSKLYIRIKDKGNIEYSKDNIEYKTFNFQIKKKIFLVKLLCQINFFFQGFSIITQILTSMKWTNILS